MDQPIELQQSFWNSWNAAKQGRPLSDISSDQRDVIVRWLSSLGRTDLDILEVGCGSGWLCPWLKPFGHVTGTDLSDEVLREVAKRIPDIRFIAGDFMALDFGGEQFDVIVTVEVLPHFADQPGFIMKLAQLLRPGGFLMLATQNRPVLEHYNTIPPPAPGQLRRWVDREELISLLTPHFKIRRLRAISPAANKGPYRLVLGRKPRQVIRSIFGRTIENAIASTGFGWTLIALAQK